MNDQLVVSIGHISFEKAIMLTRKYCFLELRLDLIDWTPNEINIFLEHSQKSILSIKQADQRPERLKDINFHYADYLDIELDAHPKHWSAIHPFIPENIPKIWSVHYYDTFVLPDKGRAAFEKRKSTHDIYKFVSFCPTQQHAQILLNAYTDYPYEIFIGLGKTGQVTRKEGIQRGAPFMYCQAEEVGAIASGQISVDDLSKHLSQNRNIHEYFLSGVIGNPIAHSLSPQLFNAFYAKKELPAQYLRIALDQVEDLNYLSSFLPLRFINITAPFKNDWNTDHPVNYLQWHPTEEKGNTDFLAVIDIIKQYPTLKSILIVGTGGAAEAVALAARALQWDATLTGRNQEKLTTLSEKYKQSALPFDQLKSAIHHYDAIAWTIPASVAHELDLIFHPDQLIIDVHYTSTLRDYVQTPSKHYYTGRHWLILQALPIMRTYGSTPTFGELLKTLEESPHRISNKAITLIGMPGAGKSTVGYFLAQLLAWEFVDLDQRIEQVEGRSIQDIFEEEGEEYFRKIEAQLLEASLKNTAVVISTGGGSVCMENNRKQLKAQSWVVWLGASLDDIKERTSSDMVRPLLSQNKSARIDALWSQRMPLYAETSDILIPTDKAPEQIAKRIYEEYCLSK